MHARPRHLADEYASQWETPEMAAVYDFRPPYPGALFDDLSARARHGYPVLDIGAGTGSIARPLAARGVSVDAVERSAAMIEQGKAASAGLPIRWVQSKIEVAELAGPYGLAVAAECLHWCDWRVALPRVASALAARAELALIERAEAPTPWDKEMRALVPRYSTNHDFAPFDLIAALERDGVFEVTERWSSESQPFAQPIGEYLETIHSRNGFSMERMAPDDARKFRDEFRAIVEPHACEGRVELEVGATVVFGRILV